MAVIEIAPGIEVIVEIDGQKAVEYDRPAEDSTAGDDNDDAEVQVLASAMSGSQSFRVEIKQQPHVVKYIEAKPGARFGVRVIKRPEFKRLSDGLGIDLEIDGEFVGTLWEGHNSRGKSRTKGWKGSGVFDSMWSGNPESGYQDHQFRFASLEIESTHARPTQQDLTRGKCCGVIRADIRHYRVRRLKAPIPRSLGSPTEVASLPEVALKGKAVSIRTEFDSGSMAPLKADEWDHTELDPEGRPGATFEFLYRTKEDLMQEGIIPRPSIEEVVRDMSDADIRQDYLRMKQREERLSEADAMRGNSNVKLEQSGTAMRGVKREATEMGGESSMPGPSYKSRRLDSGRIEIDLTD